MPFSGRFRAVVFDMDGLLLDTETLWHRAEVELFRRHDATFTWDDKMAIMGQEAGHTARYFAERLDLPPEQGWDLVVELLELMRAEMARAVAGRPGALELLARLRSTNGIRLALASNSPRPLVDAALSTTGLEDAFEAVVTPEDVARGKPAPDLYLEACRRLGVPPEEALALEDSPSGVAAAKAAGLTCIAVPQYAALDVSAADRVIDSLEELLAE